MQCVACRHDNAFDSRFCERCGDRLERRCLVCDTPVSGSERVCCRCGAAQGAAATPAAGHEGPVGERRQLTAMFCDLENYTGLARRIDPEDLREILLPYQRICAEAVERYGGCVAQYLGDGVLGYFGFPRAYEDNAERAVRAALAIQAGLARRGVDRSDASQPGVSARIGIHTGLVVMTRMGDEAHGETLALGDTINVASRLQAIADPGGILISGSTHQLVPGLFVVRDLGTPALKGVSDAIRVYAVVGRARVGGPRFSGSPALSPLVGRERELRRCLDCWERAESGKGQVLMISGEPGMGKSRLLLEFQLALRQTLRFTLELRCSPHAVGAAFQPVIDLYEQGFGFDSGDDPDARLFKLETVLDQIAGLERTEVVPYLAALLSLPPSPRFPLEHMAPEVQREKTIEALVAPVLCLAAQQPVLVAVEDLHWSDPSTLQLLGRLIDRIADRRVLLLLTSRPSFEPPWVSPGSAMPSWPLSALDRVEARRLVEAVAGQRLPDAVVEEIVDRADGVPLFAEELARSVADAKASAGFAPGGRSAVAADFKVPATLQDSLMARLDRLDAGKRVAQLASILGREFPFSLIEAMGELKPPELQSGLRELMHAGILLRLDDPSDPTYVFRHILIQDTAYGSQLKRRRCALHARAVEVLQQRFPQRVGTDPEYVAGHCAAGALPEAAAHYYQQAGEQAVVRFASAEAIEHFRRALALLAKLPESDTRHLKEMELRLALGGPLTALRGYEDPEAIASCERVESLCAAMAEGPERLPALLGLTLYHLNCGQLYRARQHAVTMLRTAAPLGVKSLLVAGYVLKGTSGLTGATVSEACEDLERAIDLARQADLRPPTRAFDADLLTTAYTALSIGLVSAGRIDRALEMGERGIRRARELCHPRTLASALVNFSLACTFLEDAPRVRELTTECLERIEGRGFHVVEFSARIQSGWARTSLGDAAAVSEVDRALEDAGRSGTRGGIAALFYFLGAEAYARSGRLDDAFAALLEGERLIERTGETITFQAMLLTARARILLASPTPDLEEVKRLWLEAFALFEESKAPWLQLECALRVAEMTRRGAAAAESRQRLAAVCERIVGGREAPRMRAASALLQEPAG
jgi:class 3 adenylate cyclase/tetratricopeptide (TPR) repeat protein